MLHLLVQMLVDTEQHKGKPREIFTPSSFDKDLLVNFTQFTSSQVLFGSSILSWTQNISLKEINATPAALSVMSNSPDGKIPNCDDWVLLTISWQLQVKCKIYRFTLTDFNFYNDIEWNTIILGVLTGNSSHWIFPFSNWLWRTHRIPSNQKNLHQYRETRNAMRLA